MSIQQKHVKRSFKTMVEDKTLELSVKVWFIIFMCENNQALQQQIRHPLETSDMAKFLQRNKVKNIDQVPSCACSKCGKEVTSPRYRVLGRCCDCNKKVCAVKSDHKRRSWVQHNGRFDDGYCYCCGATIYRTDFSAAHVVASCFGGMGKVDNMVPTCHSCNAAMGTTHLHVYADELCTIRRELRTSPEFKAAMEDKWNALVRAWSPTSRR